jgi:class I fructose-bisphosphate aldolase
VAAAGKELRWSRFVGRESGRALLVPIDHGLTMGPIQGLSSVREIIRWLRHPAINGVVAHKGMMSRLAEAGVLNGVGVMVHLNGMTATGEQPDTKHVVTSMEAAIRLGADAVSLQVNFGPDNHAHNLVQLGRVVDQAERFALPVMAMVYPTGPADEAPGRLMRQHRHYLRVAFELGVDVVKTAPPQDLSDIPELLDGIGDDLRVLISGGALSADDSLFQLAEKVAGSSAAGLCIGRNVFQRSDPRPLLSRLRELIDGGARRCAPSVEDTEPSLSAIEYCAS